MDVVNPLTLKFHDPRVERLYEQAVTEEAVRRDTFGFLVLVAGSSVLLPISEVPSVIRIMRQLLVVLVPIAICLAITMRAAYMKWRIGAHGVLTSSCLVNLYLTGSMLLPAEPNSVSFLKALAGSSVLCLPVQNLLVPLQFQTQVKVNIVVLAFSVNWTDRFCTICEVSPYDYSQFMHFLGSLNRNIVTILSLGATGTVDPKVACFPNLMFLVTTIGFLLPLFALYRSEMTSRIDFLRTAMPTKDKSRIANFCRDCIGWSSWVFCIAVICAWGLW